MTISRDHSHYSRARPAWAFLLGNEARYLQASELHAKFSDQARRNLPKRLAASSKVSTRLQKANRTCCAPSRRSFWKLHAGTAATPISFTSSRVNATSSPNPKLLTSVITYSA